VQGREADIGEGEELEEQETGGGVGEGHGGPRKENEGGAKEW